jgi:hypothetical protein
MQLASAKHFKSASEWATIRSNLEIVPRARRQISWSNIADETDRFTQTFGNSAPTLVVMAEEADVENASRDGA